MHVAIVEGSGIIVRMGQRTLRLLDANFNRAREALRVLEDYARFMLNDTRLTRLAKDVRHDLCQAMGQLSAGELLGARDTPGDVGTVISNAAELQRSDCRAVTVAAGKRLSEALRCLEEYSKIEMPVLAGQIEALRYRSYQLEKEILVRTGGPERFSGVRLYVLLTGEYCPAGVLATCERVLAGGADCVQLREKGMPDCELLGLARQVGRLCHDAGALFLMNDRVDLAVLSGADGVHLGQQDVSVADARRLLGADAIVGKSTHNVQEARAGLAEGPDYIAFGSVFGSATKPDVACMGTAGLAEVAKLADGVPVIAIGGITSENAAEAVAAGANGVAVCQAATMVGDPEMESKRIKEVVT